MDLEAHPGHVSMLFEPYKSIGVEIKSIGESQSRFLSLLLFFPTKWNPGYQRIMLGQQDFWKFLEK